MNLDEAKNEYSTSDGTTTFNCDMEKHHDN